MKPLPDSVLFCAFHFIMINFNWQICGPGGSSAYSKDIIHFYINRAGCDGVASSLMTADMCGVCGGHDDCIDCTGAAHGGMICAILIMGLHIEE